MFCPDCGTQCQSKFCPNCGKDLNGVEIKKTIPPLSEPYYYERNGKKIDLHRIIKIYGTGWRKSGAYGYLMTELGISMREAKEILDPLYISHAGEEITFGQGLKENLSQMVDDAQEETLRKKEIQRTKDQKRAELEMSGVAYCPKCMSTSVTAVKKGFSAGRAILTNNVLVGAIGANKLKCVCLKCGYKWKP